MPHCSNKWGWTMNTDRFVLLFSLILFVWIPSSGANNPTNDMASFSIEGVIDIKPELKAKLSPTDRLVIKLFHPKDGIEMDAKFSIISDFQLPLEFRVSPYIVMDGTTRHEKYVIEVFTDKDQDVLRIADGELLGRTAGTVELGSRDLQIILNLLRK